MLCRVLAFHQRKQHVDQASSSVGLPRIWIRTSDIQSECSVGATKHKQNAVKRNFPRVSALMLQLPRRFMRRSDEDFFQVRARPAQSMNSSVNVSVLSKVLTENARGLVGQVE